MTRARAALAAAALAVIVYLPALGNQFALDDGAIVERNPAAHSVERAAAALGRPYWPPEHPAGLWRPLVILSFAADWQVSGGSPRWLHMANVAWHALAAALVVAVLCGWVAPAAALAGGAVFAVHPVHVEAVANLVGRAELMAATFVLAALLLARLVREQRARGRRAWREEVLLVAAVTFGLLCKESAAVAPALLVLDAWATRGRERGRLPWHAWAAVATVTVVWFLARGAVEAGASFAEVAPTFLHLGAGARLATMLPVVFVLVRLMVWPFDLSADYHPQVVDRLLTMTPLAGAGLVLLFAVAILAIALRRHAPLVTLALAIIAVAWLPTANVLFPTGIVIAERTLYLPSVGVALLAAAGWSAVVARRDPRVAALAAAAVVVAFGARAAARAPQWHDNRSLTVASLLTHPESYKVHQVYARVLMHLGDRPAALREYRLAAELFPLDQYLLTEIGATEMEAGMLRAAARSLRRAITLDSNYTLSQQLLANTLLLMDSVPEARVHAGRAVETGPTRSLAARMLAAAHLRAGHADSALAVWEQFERRGGARFERWLYQASTYGAIGEPARARQALLLAIGAARWDAATLASVREAQSIVHEARGADRQPLR